MNYLFRSIKRVVNGRAMPSFLACTFSFCCYTHIGNSFPMVCCFVESAVIQYSNSSLLTCRFTPLKSFFFLIYVNKNAIKFSKCLVVFSFDFSGYFYKLLNLSMN